jgi:eukaryotic-like serine/threonine-protein kinase
MRDPVVGDKLDQFELTELLARSGMAAIFKAVDTEIGRVVALKIPHVQYESDVVFFERFRREEAILQKLDHPNIVKALTTREKSRMYLAMEYVEGTSLRALLGEKHPLPTARALDLARQVCGALVYLHARGVLHRDVKPENVLVTKEGQAKLLDFGIALDQSARRLTWSGLSATVGTPDYMAPEQIRGRRGDARTDVFALGTMLYEMLTCQLPFDSPNPQALLRAKASEQAKPPRYYVPDIDPSLEAIILRSIARAPRDRYTTAAELLADLQDPSRVASRDPQEVERRGIRRGRNRWLLILGLASVLAGLAALVWLTHGQSGQPPPLPAATRGR